MEKLYTVQMIAERVKKTDQTIRLHIKNGKLKAIKIFGGSWRVQESDLDAYINGGEKE